MFQKFDMTMKKVILFFEAMSAKDLIKFLVELCMIFFIIFLFRIPFALLEDLVTSFFYRYGGLSFLSNLFGFFIQLAYGLLAIASFLYVIKIKYIDKVDDTKLIKEKIPTERIEKEEVEENKETGEVVRKVYVKKQGKTVSDVLTTLIVYFLKFLILLFLFGAFIGLLCMIVLFGMSTSFAIEGLPVVGVSIGLLGAILLMLCVIEPAVNFVLNHKNSFKRLLITFLISLVLLGVGTTVFTLDFLDITYVDKAPSQYEKHLESSQFTMNETLHTCYLPHRFLSYEEDESLENIVQVDYTYYGDRTITIEQEHYEGLYVEYQNDESELNFQELLKIVKEDLKNRRLYNYDSYNSIEITIKSSSKNIAKIMENNKTCY